MSEVQQSGDILSSQAQASALAGAEHWGGHAYTRAIVVLGRLATDAIVAPPAAVDLSHIDAWRSPRGQVDRTATLAHAHYQDFVNDSGNAQLIAEHQRLLGAFDRFAPHVAALRQALANEDPVARPAPVGSGWSFAVYRLEVDGEVYAVRLPYRDADWSLPTLERRISGGVRARGHDEFQQMVAASYEHRAIVSEWVPGRVLQSFSPEELASLSAETLDSWIECVVQAGRQGYYDFNTQNFVQHETTGRIVFIDTDRSDEPHPQPSNFDGQMTALVRAFGTFGRGRINACNSSGRPAEPVKAAMRNLLNRFVERCAASVYAGEEGPANLRHLCDECDQLLEKFSAP